VRPLHIVQLNLAYDKGMASPEALLDSYATLTGWSDAVTGAGADVSVVQRFASDATVTRGPVSYRFVADDGPGVPEPWHTPARVTEAVCALGADVVHVNGLLFPGAIQRLRNHLPATTAVVVQDHSGAVPRLPPWPLTARASARWCEAYRAVDAVTFTAAALFDPWAKLGLPPTLPVIEILEASTDVEPLPRHEARELTGIAADPAVLWVGRLNANKDPMTVLDALDRAFAQLPNARCWMLYGADDLLADVQSRIAASDRLRQQVTLVGKIAPANVPLYLSAADIFVSGSRHEGSGYALLEAMACGVIPCVTDIPAFRAITRTCGQRWTPGDATACAKAILTLAGPDREAAQRAVRRHFIEALSWTVIGQHTVREYRGLSGGRLRAERS
jgi:glycosyltransferase involved in cell wall biosynthesis